MKKDKNKWKTLKSNILNLPNNNMILEGKGFFISYNSDTGRSRLGKIMDDTLNLTGEILGKEKGGGEETALVKKGEQRSEYYILNGDFRKQYEKLIDKGFDVCYEFYRKNKKHISSFSEDQKTDLI